MVVLKSLFSSSKMSVLKRNILNNFCQVLIRNSCNVSRFKLQNLIKTNQAECLKHMESSGKFILFHKDRPLLKEGSTGPRKEPNLISFNKALEYLPNLSSESVFLRVHPENGPLFAAQIPESFNPEDLETGLLGNFTNMRAAMFFVDDKKWAPYLCQSYSLLRWNTKTTFCSSCGEKLNRNASGGQRDCPGCKSVHYPITNPVAIVLMTVPDHSKVLLIRQPVYPPGMYSCVAGFVDLGETLFECVQRESAEEVSVDLLEDHGIQFLSSQFWPFPSGSLMMGCMAFASPDATPVPCQDEVEAARWFSPKEISEALERVRKNPGLRMNLENNPDNLFVPPKGTVANSMLRTWLEKFAKK